MNRAEQLQRLRAELRPLVRPLQDEDGHAPTQALSREHTVLLDRSGLVTGGKWTTYRAMAQDVLAQCAAGGLLAARAAGVTEHLRLAGAPVGPVAPLTGPPGAHGYGTDQPALNALPGADAWLWRDGAGGLTEAMVRFAARVEMARSVEDALARRCRLLFLDARRAASLADRVGAIPREELGAGFDAQASAASFKALAAHYLELP
jgi:glycerol-3-phosphate dehydrogenase